MGQRCIVSEKKDKNVCFKILNKLTSINKFRCIGLIDIHTSSTLFLQFSNSHFVFKSHAFLRHLKFSIPWNVLCREKNVFSQIKLKNCSYFFLSLPAGIHKFILTISSLDYINISTACTCNATDTDTADIFRSKLEPFLTLYIKWLYAKLLRKANFQWTNVVYNFVIVS